MHARGAASVGVFLLAGLLGCAPGMGTGGMAEESLSSDRSGGASNGGWTGGGTSSGGGAPGTSSGGQVGGASSGSAVNPGTVIAFGGAQDFAYFRQIVEGGGIPQASDMDSPGFFAEHHTSLPPPACGNDICLQGLVGARENMINGAACTVLQLGLNSPIQVSELPQKPRRMVLVIDESGSMNGHNMDMVKQGLTLMAAEMDPADKWALVTFGDAVAKQGTWRQYDSLDWHNAVESLSADAGSTNIHAGLMRGFELLEEEDGGLDPDYQNRLILLSDGIANRGVTDVDVIVGEAVVHMRRGIGLSTIGVGTAFDPVLMARLAEATGGGFYFADTQQALSEIFLEEIRTFLVPVAYDVHIEVEGGAYYTLRAAYGANQFSLASNRRSGQLTIPAVTLAHRQSHDDNQNGRRGGGSALLIEALAAPNPEQNISNPSDGLSQPTALARARLTYFSVADQMERSQELLMEYPHGPETMLPDGYFTHEAIQKNFVMLNLYVGFQMAVLNYHNGNGGQALADLDALMAAATTWNAEIGDEDIADDLRIMALLRANIDAEVNAPPPEEASNPWPND